jgi:hypothetical protein
MVEGGRGAGWHHFTSLSAPILSWYASYYRPGCLTAGFETLVTDVRWGDGHRSVEADLQMSGAPGRSAVVLCVLGPGAAQRATVNGAVVPVRVLPSGTFEVRVPGGSGRRKLVVG